MPNRVAILVDAMYLQNVCHGYDVERFDVTKIPTMVLRPGEELSRTYLFDALPFTPPGASIDQAQAREAKRRYFDKLGYLEHVTVEQGHVQPKQIVCRHCKEVFFVPVQKQVDVKMSVRLVQLAFSHTLETIVLMAGDGDLLPAVKAVDGTGVNVRLSYAEIPERSVFASHDLVRACQEKQRLERAHVQTLALHY